MTLVDVISNKATRESVEGYQPQNTARRNEQFKKQKTYHISKRVGRAVSKRKYRQEQINDVDTEIEQ